jgi:Transcription factor WhiB/Papain family cysteine protease
VLQLDRTIAALDAGWPVAFYGWWPIEAAAVTTDILGVDAMEVPPPDRKRTTLADGHAVVLIGYGRHDSFPGGGYVIVRNCWRDWGDDGDGYMPFTFVRTYATELRAYRFPGSRRAAGGGGPSRADRPAAGSPRLPAVVPQLGRRTTTDAHIDRHARCADQRASLTHLFFSDDVIELARARAICSMCEVRQQCLARALERREPYGIWGGEMVIDGQAVADKRGRGRPPKRPPPRLVVDEITGVPIVA